MGYGLVGCHNCSEGFVYIKYAALYQYKTASQRGSLLLPHLCISARAGVLCLPFFLLPSLTHIVLMHMFIMDTIVIAALCLGCWCRRL